MTVIPVPRTAYATRAAARRRSKALAATAVLILIAVFWASPVLILVGTAVKTAAPLLQADAHAPV